ncbi:MAG TPA: SRPBCC domain-containing protein [Chitinophagaceae bacterium]|nr:SRPBCC domain-containing protein [Chitinophagaceae bacterium]
MTTLKFTTKINAPKEKVWETLWNDTSYRKWTAAFMEGSYAESDWKEGSKILFLTPKGDGMFSIIEKKIPNQEMTFKHLGELKNGIEESKNWEGAKESYHLEEKNGITELDVQLDSVGEFEQYFNDTFPKALNVLKQIAEQ